MEDIRAKAIKHNKICDDLRKKGYTIQGCDRNFRKHYFADGNKPFAKIIGYIDIKTLEVVYSEYGD